MQVHAFSAVDQIVSRIRPLDVLVGSVAARFLPQGTALAGCDGTVCYTKCESSAFRCNIQDKFEVVNYTANDAYECSLGLVQRCPTLTCMDSFTCAYFGYGI
jgi:hypothetical protein